MLKVTSNVLAPILGSNRHGLASLGVVQARWIYPALALFLVCPPPALSEDPGKTTSLEIVDRAIEHHGGEVYEQSLTELEICSKSGCFELRVRRDGGLFDYRAKGEVRGSLREVRATNDELWHFEDGQEVEVEADRAAGLRDWVSARVYFPFLPFRLNDESVFKQDLGLETWDGQALHKVKVTFVAGSSTSASDEYMYWFEPETGRLVQFAYSFSGDPGGLRFRRGLNYRRVGGILFFDQENLGLAGDELRVDEITPAMVEEMPVISMVRFENIRVTPVGR